MAAQKVPAGAEERLAAGRVLLGHRLRDVRMELGLNLPELASLTGLTISHLSDCERGRRLPSLPALLAIADAYGILVSVLLDGVYPFGQQRAPRRLPGPPLDGRST